VRRISLQVVIEHMNNNPDLLAKKMEASPTFASRLWNIAIAGDSRTRGVLDVLADHPCLNATTPEAIGSVAYEVARLYYHAGLMSDRGGGPIVMSDEAVRRNCLDYVEIVSGILRSKHRVDTGEILNLMLPTGHFRPEKIDGEEEEDEGL